MEPALGVALLWVLFGGTHIGLATRRVRAALVDRLGEVGFLVLFFAVAALSFTVLVGYYTACRFEGAAGLGLAAIPALRWPLMLVVVAGLMLSGPGLAIYPKMPTALFGQPIRSVRGIERLTRHPFFAGMALFALAHALLATRLVGTVFFAALALLAIVGAHHQDVKLLARRGHAYAAYLAATSAVPFAAVLSGRQQLLWRELPLGMLLVALAVALALRVWHDALFANGGMWIVAAVVGGGVVAGWSAWRRARRIGIVATIRA